MKNKLIIYSLLFVFCSGCTPILKLFYGVHEPKAEDSISLRKYYGKKGINTNNMLVLSDSIKYKARFKEVGGFPEIRVFNKEGYLVYHKDTTVSCNGPAYEFTESICKVSNLKVNPDKKLNDEINCLLTLDKSPLLLSSDEVFDYYVFIYCARFLGRLNKDHVKVWENNLKHVTGCKVKYYKVDMDWQKSWDQ